MSVNSINTNIQTQFLNESGKLESSTAEEAISQNFSGSKNNSFEQDFQSQNRRWQIETQFDERQTSLQSNDNQPTAQITQLKETVRSSNPNGIINAVESATGLARVFGNVGEDGSIGHDGVHVVAPVGSKIKTLPVLEGKVIDSHDQGDGSFALDVLVNKPGQKPFVVIYKDINIDKKILAALKRGAHPTLKAGDVIGKTADGGESMGVHVALLRGGQKEHDYYRLQTRTKYGLNAQIDDINVKKYEAKAKGDMALVEKYQKQVDKLEVKVNQAERNIQADLFLDPLSPDSPINCPDIKADPAGVEPYKTQKQGAL